MYSHNLSIDTKKTTCVLMVSREKKKVLEDQKSLCLMPTLLVSSCYLLSGLVHQRGDTSHLYQQT